MENAVEEIKKRVDVVEHIGSLVPLKKLGRNFKALCPFHQEKTPSFVVSPERQIWHCFGSCQEGGDIIKFVMKWENITFIEALRDLADRVGVRLTNLRLEDHQWKKKEKLLGINHLAMEFFEHILYKTDYGKKGVDYLSRRTIDERVVKKFHLGYAPDSWDSLLNFLKKKNYEPEEIAETGIVVKNDENRLYDRFRGRLMFPIIDTREQVVGFSGRSLEEKVHEAKYINTPETSLYHKRGTLFGIHAAKDAIRKEGFAVFVEGEFDVISPYQHGIENIVAIKGSAVTKEQLILIKRYTNRIVLSLDADTAGEEATKRAIDEAEALDFDIGVITIDFGKDPDEAVRTDSTRFKKLIKKPIPIYDFIIEASQKKHNKEDPFGKKKIAGEVTPLIEKIRNPIVRSHYIKKLALLLDVSETSVETLIKKQRKKPSLAPSRDQRRDTKTIREFVIQKYILSLLFQHKDPYSLSDVVFSVLDEGDFSVPSYKKIVEVFFDYKKNNTSFHLRNFAHTISAELLPVFDEIYLFATSGVVFEGENLTKLMLEVKRYSLKRKIGNFLKGGEDDNKKAQLVQLGKQLNEVEKRLLSL